jgi:hypothetical protein
MISVLLFKGYWRLPWIELLRYLIGDVVEKKEALLG